MVGNTRGLQAGWLGQRAVHEVQRGPAAGETSPIELAVSYDAVNGFLADYLQTISQGQAFVATERSLAVGTRLELRVAVPGAPPLAVRGRVSEGLGAMPAAPLALSGIAIEFVFQGEGERLAMHSWVEALLTEQFGAHHAAALLSSGRG